MGKYHDWADVSNHYHQAATAGGSTHVGSAWLVYSETEVESRLASHYTVPFSSNNITVRDICIDLSYGRMAVGKDEDAQRILDSAYDRIDALKNGEMTMLTNSGESIGQSAATMWSNTASYHSAFGMDDVLDFQVSSLEAGADYDARS